jgi:hypothetical protein
MAHEPADKPDSLPTLSIEDAGGDELFRAEPADERRFVVAADAEGNSLTLLEEYARRRGQPSIGELAFSFFCAAASLAFAVLIHINMH